MVRAGAGCPDERQKIEVLLQSRLDGGIPVGHQAVTEQSDRLGRFSPAGQHLGLDFDGGAQSSRQVGFGIEGALGQQLPRQTLGLAGIGLGAIQLVGLKAGPGHPGKGFHVVRRRALASAIALQFGLGGGKVIPRQGLAHIVADASEGGSRKHQKSGEKTKNHAP